MSIFPYLRTPHGLAIVLCDFSLVIPLQVNGQSAIQSFFPHTPPQLRAVPAYIAFAAATYLEPQYDPNSHHVLNLEKHHHLSLCPTHPKFVPSEYLLSFFVVPATGSPSLFTALVSFGTKKSLWIACSREYLQPRRWRTLQSLLCRRRRLGICLTLTNLKLCLVASREHVTFAAGSRNLRRNFS